MTLDDVDYRNQMNYSPRDWTVAQGVDCELKLVYRTMFDLIAETKNKESEENELKTTSCVSQFFLLVKINELLVKDSFVVSNVEGMYLVMVFRYWQVDFSLDLHQHMDTVVGYLFELFQ